jgi:DNA (cytosine-5)-methyltransferase 1
MRVLDLFSGIGGFSLGLERAGMTTVAFCEIEPYCRAVLKKHWPHVPCYEDVRTLTAQRLAADGIAVDVICGGFPCQDISCAGAGAGIEGERSGLWREYARLIGELRPRYVIVENVSALLGRGLGTVLGDLAALGFDAEWHCIPASAVGAPHRRDRVWIVAYPRGEQHEGDSAALEGQGATELPEAPLAHADSLRAAQSARGKREGRLGPVLGREALADAHARDQQRRGSPVQMGWGRFARQALEDGVPSGAEWRTEPDVGRVAHGVPSRVDRLGSLGNAVVPQIPEIIGRAIMEARP